MKKQGAPAVAPDRRRKPRARPTPRWLASTADLDATARSRCLMVLSVLSGEKPVSDAIVEAKISRGTYYQMQTRALKAMLAALNPLASTKEDGSADLSAAAAARIEELEEKLGALEKHRRRAERLLYVTRKAMRLAPIALPRGRKPKSALPALMPIARRRSKRSKAKASASPGSTPTTAGEGVR